MSTNRFLLSVLFLALFFFCDALSALAEPEPLSASEEQLLQEQEAQSRIGGVQAGDYSKPRHVWSTIDQLGLALLLSGMIVIGVYGCSKLLSRYRLKKMPDREKRNWCRGGCEGTGVVSSINPFHKQTGWIQAKVRDISRGGAGLELIQESRPVSPGDRIKLELKADGQTSLGELTGKIRWVSGKNIGVQFDSLDLSYKILQSSPLTLIPA